MRLDEVDVARKSSAGDRDDGPLFRDPDPMTGGECLAGAPMGFEPVAAKHFEGSSDAVGDRVDRECGRSERRGLDERLVDRIALEPTCPYPFRPVEPFEVERKPVGFRYGRE